MAKVKSNSFEAREKKNKKRSSIMKMTELREETFENINTEPKIDTKIESKRDEKIESKKEEVKNIEKNNRDEDVKVVNKIQEENLDKVVKNEYINTKSENTVKDFEIEESVNEIDQDINPYDADKAINDFFNLNIKNDIFEGKMTTVRVYDDILDKLKTYAGMKNYPIIEFTNKVITLGLDDFANFGVLEISEIKLKNNTSRSIMYNLTDIMEEKLNRYIYELNTKGYKVSRNVILNVILNETLKKFYV